jgi:hypothetical protein
MKKCRICKSPYEPHNSLQRACGPTCALALVKLDNERKAAKVVKESRVWVKQQKERLKTRRDYEKDCQRDFNKFIRNRDLHLPCICCGQWGDDEFWKVGGQWDAGHYLSVGSHPEYRFDEANCHKQLKSCNAGEGKYAGKRRTVSEEYRVRLIEKIGQAEVDRLEGPNEAKKYAADEMKAMAAHYRARTREIQKVRMAA